MSYGELLRSVPEALRNAYRQYETASKKYLDTIWSLEFNRTCINEGILPNYTKFRCYDPAVKSTETTLKYRKYLVNREIECKTELKLNLEQKKHVLFQAIESFPLEGDLKDPVTLALNSILDNYSNITKTRIVKKLNSLYHGRHTVGPSDSICVKTENPTFINLSKYELTPDEKEFLSLGLNCHIRPKYDKVQKQVEIEMLYQSLLKLEENKKIEIKTGLADQLKGESRKHRNSKESSILTPMLIKAAKKLKSNEDIVIRRADKSPTYVILNKDDYMNKIKEILSDPTKFKCIGRDPCKTLKQNVNGVIDKVNAVRGDLKLDKIIGDYQPGYMYGNVKTHKNGNPLRPIISQIPTPTYQLAKTLNQIISPYIPKDYLLNSTKDFIDILRTSPCNGIIASLDVQSLFTNVPIDETIDIIVHNVSNHPHLPVPKIPLTLLRRLLELCTKEAPFRSPDGKLYVQIEGVAMGSPLGPTFANFYMGEIEKRVFESDANKPSLYARYVDDIFVQVTDEKEIKLLQKSFQKKSVLEFTYEMNVDGKLPFLDVLVDTSEKTFHTSVYQKPTNTGHCLNAKSECAEKYKDSVITNYLNRAYKISTSWAAFHSEVQRIKQVLVNNNYSNAKVDSHVKKFIDNKLSLDKQPRTPKYLNVFYKNQTHSNYKIEERVIKNLVMNNTKCVDENSKQKVIFYYQNKRTHNLVLKNNTAPPPPPLQQCNVVYQFQCPLPHSKAENYIGCTTTTLSRRLTMHRQNGSILKHFTDVHDRKPTRDELIENTTIIGREVTKYRLAVKEALIILNTEPSLNIQFDNFSTILKLYSNQHHTHIAPVPNLPSLPTNLKESVSRSPTCPIDFQNSLTVDKHINKVTLVINNSSQPSPPPCTPPTPPSFLFMDPCNSSKCETIHSSPKPAKEYQLNESQSELDDMEEVLLRFGIEYSKLVQVPLADYQWMNFGHVLTPIRPLNSQAFDSNKIEQEDRALSPTISQRIRTLRRKARNNNTTQTWS